MFQFDDSFLERVGLSNKKLSVLEKLKSNSQVEC